MNNPYMDSTTDDFVLSVNDVTPDAFGDVKLTISSMSGNAVENPQTNEVLQYDGSKWINKLLTLVGLPDCLIYNISIPNGAIVHWLLIYLVWQIAK